MPKQLDKPIIIRSILLFIYLFISEAASLVEERKEGDGFVVF
jgi:hypothetical protein